MSSSPHRQIPDWVYRLALSSIGDTRPPRALLADAADAFAEAYHTPFVYIMAFDPRGTAEDVVPAGGAFTPEQHAVWDHLVGQGVILRAQAGAHAAVGRDSGAAAVVMRGRDETPVGLVVVAHDDRTAFESAQLHALTDAAAVVGAALSAAMAREAQAQEESQKQQLQRDLVAMTYHDMRAPLQHIQTTFAVLDRLIPANVVPQAGEYVAAGTRAIRQVSRMIRTLLDMGRLENNSMTLNRRAVAPEAIIAQAFQIVSGTAADASQTLVSCVDRDLPRVRLDAEVVQRVLINLIENAIKYTPAGGTITVAARADGQGIRLSVTDSGPGIPPHLRDAVFDRYYRIRGSGAREGVGLGLAFWRRTAGASGWRVSRAAALSSRSSCLRRRMPCRMPRFPAPPSDGR
jgi:K+-sensing histidine kinase KdpD